MAARTAAEWSGTDRRRAAVLIPLFLDDDQIRVVLTKRSTLLRSHPGEVSFPGGNLDLGDADLRHTALREAQEEVGIDPAQVDVIGSLDDMPTASSGYVIRPFIGLIPSASGLSADAAEVERILTPRLEVFNDPDRQRMEIRERDGVRFPVLYYDIEGDVVWGATARILMSLICVLEGREPPRPPEIPVP